MTDKKYTDEEIIRALECHFNEELDEEPFMCVDCPLYNDTSPSCTEALRSYARDLINSQKAEIEGLNIQVRELWKMASLYKAESERWEGYNENLLTANTALSNEIPEAYKEFAARLKEKLEDCHIISDGEYCGFDCGDVHECLNILLKEMVGEKE